MLRASHELRNQEGQIVFGTFENVRTVVRIKSIRLANIQRTRNKLFEIACKTAIVQFVHEGRKSEIYQVFEIIFQ